MTSVLSGFFPGYTLALILATLRLFVFGNRLPAFRLPSIAVRFLSMRLAADIPARVPVQRGGGWRYHRRRCDGVFNLSHGMGKVRC